jgi:hypothetical protein
LILPQEAVFIESEVAENDTQKTVDKAADWIEDVGGNIPLKDYALDRMILPLVC